MRHPFPTLSGGCVVIAWMVLLLLAGTCTMAGEAALGQRPGNPLARVRHASRVRQSQAVMSRHPGHQQPGVYAVDSKNLTELPATQPSTVAPLGVGAAVPATMPTDVHAHPPPDGAPIISEMRSTGFGRFDRVYVINLEKRADRLASISATAASIGVTNFTIVRGVPHTCGALGCALAHILALQTCLAAGNQGGGVDTCLILEDDFVVRGDPGGVNTQVDRFFEDAWPGDLKRWDVLMLSSNLQLSIRMHLDYLVRVVRGLSTSGYAVRRQYVPALVDAFAEAASLLNKDCSHRSVLAHSIDSAWLPLQARDAWFAFTTPVGYQAASFSDVKHAHADYEGV